MSNIDFVPRWASPPGETIRDALEERSLDLDDLRRALELSRDHVEALLRGAMPLTFDVAARLTAVVGGSVEFWMTRDTQYHADLARLTADEWTQHLPVQEMATLGWIPANITDWVARIDVCLQFFGVEDVPAWNARQSALVEKTRFRTSPTFEPDDYAVAAWLRKCEIELSRIECGAWDREAFARLLPELVSLSRLRDPKDFAPRLTERCAAVGVAAGIVRPPRGCPISGAARRLGNGNRSIALTARHRSDDHLWFSFFHEAGHLVLHDSDALYLDDLDAQRDSEPTPDEIEADQFAGAILVRPEYEEAVLAARRDPFALRRLASDMGVSIGVLIGHLQHRGALGYRTKLNRLKYRYVWNGPSLEKA